MNCRNSFISGIAAGILVGIGGAVYLACENKYVGAVLFSVALLSICYLGMYLFTGKIGYLGDKFDIKDLPTLGCGLIGNFVGATLFGLLCSYSKPSISQAAVVSCTAKLENSMLKAVALGAMCGILMYIAVRIYRDHKTPVGIIFCIPVFILSGFEHSIADMFYFSAAKMFTLKYAAFIICVILGNSLGAITISLLIRMSNMSKPKTNR